MALLDLSKLIIPDIPKGNAYKYGYYIIAEQPFINWKDDDFIYVPSAKKEAGLVVNLSVQFCETNILKLFEDKNGPVIIPEHDINDYQKPIFTRYIEYELATWECPENFFWSYGQAVGVLNYIKEKCGYVKGFNNENFSLIKPTGHFDNISKDLKTTGGNNNESRQ